MGSLCAHKCLRFVLHVSFSICVPINSFILAWLQSVIVIMAPNIKYPEYSNNIHNILIDNLSVTD